MHAPDHAHLFSPRNRIVVAALLLLLSSAMVVNWTINGAPPPTPAGGGFPVPYGIPIIGRFFTNVLAEPEILADTGPFRAIARLLAEPIGKPPPGGALPPPPPVTSGSGGGA